MSTWNYAQLTAEAERKITAWMTESRNRPFDEARLYRNWAYGAYLLWSSMTIRHQNEGDDARLLALTEREPQAGGSE